MQQQKMHMPSVLLSKPKTWIPGTLRKASKRFPRKMFMPTTDFIQFLFHEHQLFWVFIFPWSSKYAVSARLEQTPHDDNNTHKTTSICFNLVTFTCNVLGCRLIGSAGSTNHHGQLDSSCHLFCLSGSMNCEKL